VINVFSIHKNEIDEYTKLVQDFTYKCSKFEKIQDRVLLNKDIIKAQKINDTEAKKSYSKTFDKYLDGYTIALDPSAKAIDTYEFSKLLENTNISFFIAGAYGFENDFLKKCTKTISLSPLTFSHKLAKVILFEQIFRGFCIINNHPYHK
jgi:23S rRNA (pseudouridine1915-N3)-methyltransferase